MKILQKRDGEKSRQIPISAIIVAVILSFSIISFTDMMTANPATAQNTTTGNNQTQAGQLSFSLKLADGSNQTAQGATDPANLKNVTVNVNVQQGQEPPKKLPITALVPKDTTPEQLELCGSVGGQPEQCQPLSGKSISLDLTGGQQQQSQNNATSTTATASPPPTTQPQSYSTGFETPQITNIAFGTNDKNYGLSSAEYSPNSAYFVPVQLIDDVNVDIPIDIDVTAIIPIDIEIENAQICANLGGTQTCQINNINPVTYEFEPTTIDLASQEPTVTTQPTTTTSTAPTTTTTTEPTTSTAPTTTTTEPTTSTAPTESAPEDTTTTESAPEDTTTSDDTQSEDSGSGDTSS